MQTRHYQTIDDHQSVHFSLSAASFENKMEKKKASETVRSTTPHSSSLARFAIDHVLILH